jgi:hypothetical protein
MATAGFCDWTPNERNKSMHAPCAQPAIRVRVRSASQALGKIAYRCEEHIELARKSGLTVTPEDRPGY